MCSSGFAVTLRPGRRARYIVMLSGWILTLSGLVTALHMNLPGFSRAMVASVWLAASILQLYRQGRAFRSVAALMIAIEESRVRVSIDSFGPCRLLPGSLLFDRFGWLWIELPGSRRYGELILSSEVAEDAWRRLQVVWRWGRSAHD